MKPAPPVTRVSHDGGGRLYRRRRSRARLDGRPAPRTVVAHARPVRHLRGHRPLRQDHPGAHALRGAGRRGARRARAGRHRGSASGCASCSRTRRWRSAPEAEALLFAAARAELVAQVIRPALDEGRVVVSDRFLDSSLAYQGGARGLGVEEVERINRFATGGLLPDLTFLLEIEPGAAAARAGERDRFEDEGARRCRRPCSRPTSELAAADPARWRRIDADRPSRRGPRRGAGGGGGSPGGARRDGADAGRHRGPPAGADGAGARRWSRAARRTPTCSTGRPGTGKRTAARAFAAELLAEGDPDPDDGAPARAARHASRPDLGAAHAART